MIHEVQKKLDIFVENTQIIKKDFVWHNFMTKRLAALLYALEGRTVDCEDIGSCYNLMKNRTGMFSAYRGNMALAVATLLALRENSEVCFADTLVIYEELKSQKLRSSEFLSVAAYQIAACGVRNNFSQITERTREFYDGMKERHFVLTGYDDYIFSAMLALSNIDVHEGVEQIEEIYQRLKPEFRANNSVQTLAQILVLGGESESAVNRLIKLRSKLRERGIRMDKVYTLPLLGVLALLSVDADTLLQDLSEAREFLRAQRGFGPFSIDTQSLLLCASAVIASVYAYEAKDSIITASLATSITNIIIAQQTAMIAAVSASSSN